MSRKRSKTSSLLTILILCAAVALWIADAHKQGKFGRLPDPPKQQTSEKNDDPASPARTGIFDTYRGCMLVSDRGNDGDSFKVKFPDGRIEILRLYFVDCPESAFKTYGGGRNNHRRIEEQAADLGGITPQQAVQIGKKAKSYTTAVLEQSPFTIHTEWDNPFNDKRYHAYVELKDGGSFNFLHERLVDGGLARIHTKGAPLPDGTSERKHEDRLLEIQRTAKSSRSGAWGL